MSPSGIRLPRPKSRLRHREHKSGLASIAQSLHPRGVFTDAACDLSAEWPLPMSLVFQGPDKLESHADVYVLLAPSVGLCDRGEPVRQGPKAAVLLRVLSAATSPITATPVDSLLLLGAHAVAARRVHHRRAAHGGARGGDRTAQAARARAGGGRPAGAARGSRGQAQGGAGCAVRAGGHGPVRRKRALLLLLLLLLVLQL